MYSDEDQERSTAQKAATAGVIPSSIGATAIFNKELHEKGYFERMADFYQSTAPDVSNAIASGELQQYGDKVLEYTANHPQETAEITADLAVGGTDLTYSAFFLVVAGIAGKETLSDVRDYLSSDK